MRTFASGVRLQLPLDLAIAPTVGLRVRLPDGVVVTVAEVVAHAVSGSWVPGWKHALVEVETAPEPEAGRAAALAFGWRESGQEPSR